MNLRARQIDLTRNAILDAFLELTRTANAVSVSIPAVAQAADVSVRTVYRYFATKDELQNAAAQRMSGQLLRTVSLDNVDRENVATYLHELWTGFGGQISAVLAEHASPAGRELRRTRLPTSRAAVRRSLPSDVDDDLVDLIVALTSSSMFLELVDRMGHTPEHAAEMANRLVELIGEHIQEG